MPTQHCKCGAKYRFPDTSLGKHAKCKKCGETFVLRDEEEQGVLALTPEDPSIAPVRAESGVPGPQQGQVFLPHEPTLAIGPGSLSSKPSPRMEDAPRSYWSNVLWSFLFPAEPASLITFMIIWFVMSLAPLLSRLFGMGFLLSLLINGWFAAFRFDVIQSAAAGERDLPQLSSSGDMFWDSLASAFRWIGSWAVVMLPATAYLFLLYYQGQATLMDVIVTLSSGVANMLQFASGDLIIFTALVCMGLFFWPIVVLCVALGGFETLFRVDLIVLTVFKTFPTYLLTLALMFGAIALQQVLLGAAETGVLGGSTGFGGVAVGNSLLFLVLKAGLESYLSIVLMRLIGLYYYHGKDRFAWSWE